MRGLTDVLTLRGRCVLAAGAALALCGVGLGFEDLIRLGVLLLVLPLLTAAITRHHRLSLAVSRSVEPARVQVDETAVVTVTLENRGSRPTPMMLAEESLDYSLGDRPRFVVPRLGREDRCELRYRVRGRTRGRHRLGPLGVRLKDPFELSVRLGTVTGTSELIVLPRVHPLGGEHPRASGTGAEGSVPHMVALHGEDDVSIREYRDGDDLRRIHWPSTAKTGSMMVRQEDRPARRRAVVVLDGRAAVHAGSRSSGSFEWAVTAAASVVAHLLGHTFAVHLVTAETVDAGTAADPVDLGAALDTLALAETGPADTLQAVLHAAGPVSSAGGLVLAVVGPLDDQSALSLAALRQPGSTAFAMLVDPAGFGGRAGAPDGPGTDAVESTERALRAAGWGTTRVSPGTPVARAWSALQLAGAGR